jgi:hypothetical protein
MSDAAAPAAPTPAPVPTVPTDAERKERVVAMLSGPMPTGLAARVERAGVLDWITAANDRIERLEANQAKLEATIAAMTSRLPGEIDQAPSADP